MCVCVCLGRRRGAAAKVEGLTSRTPGERGDGFFPFVLRSTMAGDVGAKCPGKGFFSFSIFSFDLMMVEEEESRQQGIRSILLDCGKV